MYKLKIEVEIRMEEALYDMRFTHQKDNKEIK